jgi:hypothetical protein
MRIWLSALAVIVANAITKASGPLLLGQRPLPALAAKVTGLTAPVLLAGLVVTDLGGEDWSGVDPAQVLGVAAAAAARLARAPMLLALLAGVVVTALLR